MGWIELAQDRGRREALENAVMKFEFHKMLGILLTDNRLPSQK